MTHDLVAVKCTVAYTKLLIQTGRTFAMAKTWWDPCKFSLKLLWTMVPAVEQHYKPDYTTSKTMRKVIGDYITNKPSSVSDHAGHHFSIEGSTEAQ